MGSNVHQLKSGGMHLFHAERRRVVVKSVDEGSKRARCTARKREFAYLTSLSYKLFGEKASEGSLASSIDTFENQQTGLCHCEKATVTTS